MKGSAGIPILQLVVLNRLIERMTKAPTGFFRSLFSSFQNDSDAITWEVVFGSGGMTPLDAHFTVSRLLGHERPDVTDIYLASVKGGTARGE